MGTEYAAGVRVGVCVHLMGGLTASASGRESLQSQVQRAAKGELR